MAAPQLGHELLGDGTDESSWCATTSETSDSPCGPGVVSTRMATSSPVDRDRARNAGLPYASRPSSPRNS